MLSVEAVLDPLGFVYLVEHPVGVLKNNNEVNQNVCLSCTYVLHGRGEDDDFVNLCHFCEELVAAWAHQEGALAANFEVVDERLVEVQHQRILFAVGASFHRGQKRRLHVLVHGRATRRLVPPQRLRSHRHTQATNE